MGSHSIRKQKNVKWNVKKKGKEPETHGTMGSDRETDDEDETELIKREQEWCGKPGGIINV